MTAMSESFVDLSYRGLSLAKRIKLTQVRPQTGYLELPTPMPVGTTLGIATEDGVLLEAVVTEIHEQVGNAEHAAGMQIRPNLSIEAQASWWRARFEPDKDKAPPPPDADGKVTLVSPRMSGQSAVPELMDDGRDTGVMDAIDTEIADVDAPARAAMGETQPTGRIEPRSGRMAVVRDTIVVPMGQPMEESTDVSAAPPAPRRRSSPKIKTPGDGVPTEVASGAGSRPTVGRAGTIADASPPVGPRADANRADTNVEGVPEAAAEASGEGGGRTMAMDAVDLAALGLSQSSDSLPTADAADYSDDFGGDTPPPGASDKALGAKPSKRKKKKKS
jgi:hypothetical protein